MELRDLYNSKRILTGEVIEKGKEVPLGSYYITVVVFIENEQGEFLLQKRVMKKDGKWATTGGHPKSGESSLQGIVTEIEEELGINVKENELTLFKTIQTEDDFVDLYYLRKNIDISNEDAKILFVYAKNYWREFYKGNPTELINELKEKLEPKTFNTLYKIYIDLKQKY